MIKGIRRRQFPFEEEEMGGRIGNNLDGFKAKEGRLQMSKPEFKSQETQRMGQLIIQRSSQNELQLHNVFGTNVRHFGIPISITKRPSLTLYILKWLSPLDSFDINLLMLVV
jgi:hypothetical protein